MLTHDVGPSVLMVPNSQHQVDTLCGLLGAEAGTVVVEWTGQEAVTSVECGLHVCVALVVMPLTEDPANPEHHDDAADPTASASAERLTSMQTAAQLRRLHVPVVLVAPPGCDVDDAVLPGEPAEGEVVLLMPIDQPDGLLEAARTALASCQDTRRRSLGEESADHAGGPGTPRPRQGGCGVA